MTQFKKEIKAYALKNALEFGKADPGKILPKLFQHGLKKEEIKETIPEIQKIVDEINALSQEERQLIFANYENIVKIKEEKPHDLPELPNIKRKKPVFRVAPFPSGALHIGNAKTFILNALYAEKYKGKLLLVIDDTIGSVEKPIEKESYSLIEYALSWLGVKHAGKIIYKSDRLKIYYQYAKKLIEKGKAYVCHCSQKEMRENRIKTIECSCRQFPIKIQLKRWKEIFEMKEGQATLRIKTDIMHPNPAFRDRVLFKISERPHPRVGKKYKVWPTLEMSWAIDDHLLKITHIIRGNDLMIESDMERYIWDIFKWSHPEILHTGLVNIEGIKLAKSKAKKEVQSGEYIGWHDPRTWSIQSLEKRGITSEAIRQFVKEIGLNKQDITVPIESLYAINRSIIDSIAPRHSFISNPIKLEITNKPDWKTVEIPIHPDKPEKRKISLNDIYISQADFNKFKDCEIRLLHLYNIRLNKNPLATELTSIDNKDIPKINWVSDKLQAKIFMPDGTWIKGLADSGISELIKGATLQFERFGFVKYDKKTRSKDEGIYEFWFTHK